MTHSMGEGRDNVAPAPAIEELALRLTQGGDERLILRPAPGAPYGLNRYHSAPYPRPVLAYASSTANDLSPEAAEHLLRLGPALGENYPVFLGEARNRLRAAYGLAQDTEIVFAPSGTDLEYVALAAARRHRHEAIHNVLLGADEVGSGCIHSAHGRYFAAGTALGIATTLGAPVDGMEQISLADVPVRCGRGEARGNAEIVAAVRGEIEAAARRGARTLVHLVHGSKTGLVLPARQDCEALSREYGDDVLFVVDACQARITGRAVRRYLDAGMIVLLTGSKFMGGPPFSGFALLPPDLVREAAPLPAGLATIFRQGEWSSAWHGAERLPGGGNPGLAARLEAALFELERFQALPFDTVVEVIAAFEAAAHETLLTGGIALVAPPSDSHAPEAVDHPIAMCSLVTLDISALPHAATFEMAQALHARLALTGIRLGQPVKAVRAGEGWGGTLRIGLSMPQVVRAAVLDPEARARQFQTDMQRIAEAILAPPG